MWKKNSDEPGGLTMANDDLYALYVQHKEQEPVFVHEAPLLPQVCRLL